MTPGVAELARAFQNGTATPAEATAACLASIEANDDVLAAWQVVYGEQAQASADAATAAIEHGHRVGPFHGMPFALKDIVDVDGRITTGGTAAWRDRVSPATATIGRRLLAAGGTLLGKTKTVEFALGGWGTNQHMGTPRNPWGAEAHHVPGGSSSGSGVAVSSGMAPCAIGTDTGGSVRLPASLCGIVGLKTTEGLLPTDGIVPLSHTLDTPGPMARSVEDVALMFDVLTGRNQVDIDNDWQQTAGLYEQLRRGVAGMRLGALSDSERALTTSAVLADYDRAIDQLSKLGAIIEVFEAPLPFDEMKEMAFVIVTAEAYHHHGELFENVDAPLDEAVRKRGLPGKNITAVEYIGAQLRRRDDQAEFAAALKGFDALLTPTTPDTAPPLAGVDEDSTPAHFTRAGNYLGLCGLSLPIGVTDGGLPTSLQIMGRANAEALVLRIGSAYEEARGVFPSPPLAVGVA
jgi:aspartyl-tRNA(Asn)/glutamyl-tRNA(Gln) amidotransferase subunit A